MSTSSKETASLVGMPNPRARREDLLEIAGALLIFILMLVAPENLRADEPGISVPTGVIFRSEQASREDRWLGFGSYWTPTVDDVARIERRLRVFLETSSDLEAQRIATKLERYIRQYIGYSDGDGKWILVNAFCEGHQTDDDRTWHEHLVLVMGGGSCYFRVRYKLSPPHLEQLWINGEA